LSSKSRLGDYVLCGKEICYQKQVAQKSRCRDNGKLAKSVGIKPYARLAKVTDQERRVFASTPNCLRSGGRSAASKQDKGADSAYEATVAVLLDPVNMATTAMAR
jgi:ribosomal 30S subunit maturation factor RimM